MVSRRWLTRLCATTLVVLTAAACGGGADRASVNAEGVGDTVVRVGTLSDQTGPSAGTQVPWLHGLQSVVTRTNEAGGVAGRKIELVSEDEKTDVSVGLPLYKKLVSQTPVVAILGVNGSSIQASILPVIDRDKMPVISGQATIRDMVRPVKPTFFGIAPTYADQTDVILAHGRKLTGVASPRIAVVNNGSASGVEIEKLVASRATSGFTYVGSQVLEPAATSADAQVQSLIGLAPDYVLFHGSSAGANLMGRAQQKFGSHLRVIGIAPSGGPAAYQGVDPEFGNLFQSVQWATPASVREQGTEGLIAAAEKAGFGGEVNSPDFVAGYVAGLVLVDALATAGTDLSRASFVGAMGSVDGLSTGGLTADISFSPTKHVGAQLLRPLTYDYGSGTFTAEGAFADYAGSLSNEYMS